MLIPHRDDALLEWVDAFAGYLLVSGREDGLSRLWTHALAAGETRPVDFAEPVHCAAPGDNAD